MQTRVSWSPWMLNIPFWIPLLLLSPSQTSSIGSLIIFSAQCPHSLFGPLGFKDMGSGTKSLLWLKFQLQMAWVIYLTNLYFNFSICKLEIKIVPAYSVTLNYILKQFILSDLIIQNVDCILKEELRNLRKCTIKIGFDHWVLLPQLL